MKPLDAEVDRYSTAVAGAGASALGDAAAADQVPATRGAAMAATRASAIETETTSVAAAAALADVLGDLPSAKQFSEATGRPAEPGDTSTAAAAAAAPEEGATVGVKASVPGGPDLFGSGDDASADASLASDEDLFGDDLSPVASAAEIAAAEATGTSATAAAGATAAAAAGDSEMGLADDAVADGGEQMGKFVLEDRAKKATEDLPLQHLELESTKAPKFANGSSILTWRVPPVLSLITAADQKLQQQGFAIKFAYDKDAAAAGKPAYGSNCQLVQFSDDSYCLFVDDKGFECNVRIKNDVSYIFESKGVCDSVFHWMRGAMCSVLTSYKRLQVAMPAGLGSGTLFSKGRQTNREPIKSKTTITATELLQLAETAEQQSYLSRQETARSRRVVVDSQKGLTRCFLEADDSQQEDNQATRTAGATAASELYGLPDAGASLEKIKERFKRRRFLGTPKA
ncbi:hypothetical protein, conserved [Eimeria maxima]|uniref:Uncharacterized protein n=1 Tax=Eimeria maxima TaxID=5804 RepID=U6MC65_EIMMA|nr:hypothetical protein, conserved [Eimeria maxima]CDJ61611.1 hypothetical protein, conserved [Eimeria maxima]